MHALPFNVFQRVMRLWDLVHPYNAAQAITLGVPLDADRWSAAWPQTLRRLGLGRVETKGDRYRFRPDAPVEPVEVLGQAVALDTWLSNELNRPYPPEDELPFRPFLQPTPDGGGHVGIAYHHWAADSVSIRMLLREWFYAVLDPPRCRREPFRLPAGGFWHYFGPDAAGWPLHEGGLSLLRLRTRFARVRRASSGIDSRSDHRVAFSRHALPEGVCAKLLATAKAHGLKVNDLFTAAVAQACDRHGVTPRAPGREDLAIGTIVDVRPQSSLNLDEMFGMFLGFTTTIFRGADLADWPRLLRSTAAQSDLHRRTRAASASVLRLGVGVAEARLYPPRRWSDRYLRQMPMTAGLSNVTLNGTWAAAYYPQPIRDYVRVSPTSPLLPVVFTPTTLGDRLNMGLTRQAALIDDARAGRMISDVTDRVCRVAEGETELHAR